VTGDTIPGRGYVRDDELSLTSMGPASGYLSVLVLALYISTRDVAALYSRPTVLWLLCPLLLYWLSQMWFFARRGLIDDDPVVSILKDPVSYGIGAAATAVLLAALYGLGHPRGRCPMKKSPY
jgi:hypothetical protein